MTNTILDHIEEHVLYGSDNIRRAAPKGMNFKFETVEDPTLYADVQSKRRARLELYYEQWVDERNPSGHDFMERAKKSIATHLYKDVLDDLYELRRMLWEEGLDNSPATKKIEKMTHELSGSMRGFE